jgi:hypothetical protein
MPHVRSININSNRRINLNIHNIALFALWTFGFLITVSSKIKITICLFIPHPFLFPFCSSCSISFSSILSPFHLHSVFLPLPLSPSLSFPYIHSTCAQLSPSLIAPYAPSFLSFRPLPVFSLLIPTSKSRHHFSLLCTLSPQILRNFLSHTPLILPVVSGFFDSLPSFLFVCVFVPFTQLYIHPSSFCSQTFFTGIPVPLVVLLPLSFFSSFFSFLPSIPSVSCTLLFHPFCLQTLPLSFPLLLSAYSSYTPPSLCNLEFLCPLLAFLSNIFLVLSLLLHPQTSAPYSLSCSQTSSFSS